MGKGPGRKNQGSKSLPDYAKYANPAGHQAMTEIYRSSAASPHTPKKHKGSRAINKRAAVREQI